VHESGAVGRPERRQHRLHDLEGLPRAEPAPLGQQVAKGTAGHVLHREKDVLAVGALVEHRDHVGVRQRRRRLRLADEAVDEVVVLGEGRVHDLERDDPVELEILAQVDGRHPATGDPRLNAVTPVEHLPDEWVRNRRVHR
jgi:hypothetical protein